MPFQFMCPHGHLLEGHETQMGQQTQCPICGAVMIIPVISPQPAPAAHQGAIPGVYPGLGTPGYGPAPGTPAGWQPAPGYAAAPAPQLGYAPAFAPAMGQAAAPQAMAFPQVGMLPAFAPEAGVAHEAAIPGANDPGLPQGSLPTVESAPEEPKTVRILCPNNHELHTPMDMVGQDAMCPECSVQFRLRYEDSLEYKEEKQKAQVRREQQFSQAALKWAIVAAVIVVLAIIIMLVLRSL